MQDLKIVLVQADLAWEEPDKNIKKFDKLISRIKYNPDVIILPEMFSAGFTMNVEKYAEHVDGLSFQWMKKNASLKNCAFAGSILIVEKEKYFNRFFWVNPDGSFEFYNKRHLFSMAGEDQIMTRGQEKKIISYKGWKLNLQVCYDLRFPVWSKNNYTSCGHDYDVLLYIANWPEIRNEAYKKLLPARAIENQAFVVWVNRVGTDGKGIYHTGDSMVIDPCGKVILQVGPGKEETSTGMLSRQFLDNFRNKFKVGLDWDEYHINF